MQNWEAFFDPSGGANYGSSFSTALFWTVVAGGPAGGFNLVDKWLLKPSRNAHMKALGADIRSQYRAIKPNVTFAGRIGPLQPAEKMIARNKLQWAVKMKPIHAARASAIETSYKAAKGFWKGAAWTVALTQLAELGAGLFSPGISSIARKEDFSLFMDQTPLDSSQAYTQRQRALMAIHDSQMSVRNVIGNESAFLHR